MISEVVFSCDNRTVRLDGERLRELRRQRALSRESLVDASTGPHRLSLATLKRAESGAAIYLETARRIAALLDAPLDRLLLRTTAADDAPPSLPLAAAESCALAVLPFLAVGADPTAQTLAEGLVEDLITRLGDMWFPIVCSRSSRRYGALDASEAAAELRADFLVEGSVQKAGVDLRVRARLIRAATHEQVWHGEYNRPYSALFALQDEIANQILEGVHRRMVQLVSRRQGPEHPSDLDSWELVARASHLADAGTPSGNALAREHLQIAVSKDPYLSSGWYLLAQTYQQDLVHQWAQAPRDTLQRLIEVSAAFERHHAGNAGARLIAAYVELYRGQREAAAERVRAALEAGPNLARAYSVYGQVLAMGNEPDAALEQLEMSLRLSPRDTERWAAHAASALAHFVAERHAEAAMHAEEAVSRAPELPFTQAIVASLNVWAGNLERARRALTALEALHPSMSVSGFGVINSSTDPDIARRFLDGLRRAGLPH